MILIENGNLRRRKTMLYKLSLGAALTVALAYSSAAFAQSNQPPAQYYAPGVYTGYTGHHVHGANKKPGHHYMGHHVQGANKKPAY
jgi:hypothetical protein